MGDIFFFILGGPGGPKKARFPPIWPVFWGGEKHQNGEKRGGPRGGPYVLWGMAREWGIKKNKNFSGKLWSSAGKGWGGKKKKKGALGKRNKPKKNPHGNFPESRFLGKKKKKGGGGGRGGQEAKGGKKKKKRKDRGGKGVGQKKGGAKTPQVRGKGGPPPPPPPPGFLPPPDFFPGGHQNFLTKIFPGLHFQKGSFSLWGAGAMKKKNSSHPFWFFGGGR